MKKYVLVRKPRKIIAVYDAYDLASDQQSKITPAGQENLYPTKIIEIDSCQLDPSFKYVVCYYKKDNSFEIHRIDGVFPPMAWGRNRVYDEIYLHYLRWQPEKRTTVLERLLRVKANSHNEAILLAMEYISSGC